MKKSLEKLKKRARSRVARREYSPPASASARLLRYATSDDGRTHKAKQR